MEPCGNKDCGASCEGYICTEDNKKSNCNIINGHCKNKTNCVVFNCYSLASCHKYIAESPLILQDLRKLVREARDKKNNNTLIEILKKSVNTLNKELGDDNYLYLMVNDVKKELFLIYNGNYEIKFGFVLNVPSIKFSTKNFIKTYTIDKRNQKNSIQKILKLLLKHPDVINFLEAWGFK